MKRMMLLTLCLSLRLAAQETPVYTFDVEHDHVVGSCQGTLKIFESGIHFVSDEPKDSRDWKFLDIHRVTTEGPYQLMIYTYENDAKKLGKDKAYHFTLKNRGFSEAANEFVQSKLRTDQPPAAAVEGESYTLMVEHDHVVGSCNGKMIITAEGIDFQSDKSEDARRFGYSDISKVATEGPYLLKLWSYENDAKKLGKDKLYSFRVKGGGVSEKCLDFIREHLRPME